MTNLPLALVHFLSGAIQFPRAAHLLTGLRAKRPTCREEAEDFDHGQDFLLQIGQYLEAHRRTRRYFADVLKLRAVAALTDEFVEVRERWKANRSQDRTWFDRMNEMASVEFAAAQAAAIRPELFGRGS
ncbi:MAG: hypothetical protein AB1640_16740 [bacterium]